MKPGTPIRIDADDPRETVGRHREHATLVPNDCSRDYTMAACCSAAGRAPICDGRSVILAETEAIRRE